MSTQDRRARVPRSSSGPRHWSRMVTGLGLAATLLLSSPWQVAAAPVPPPTTASFTAMQADADSTAPTGSSEELTACLLGVWLHSMEEDTQELTVYRREGYPLPPARGRTGFEFIAAGYLIYHTFGPADEPEVWNGRWEVVGPSAVEISVNQSPEPDLRETLQIASCSGEMLEIRR
jgi:hypothetical protein